MLRCEWLTEGQANPRAAGAPRPRNRRSFRRYSLLKKPEPGASASYAKSRATLFDFRREHKANNLGEHISSFHVMRGIDPSSRVKHRLARPTSS
jgi:hypothetical protein